MTPLLLAGGTGLIGSRLQTFLRPHYDVRLLTRQPKAADHFYWNPEKGEMDETALRGVGVVINLAGAGIAEKRWSEARKNLLIESRVAGARVLHRALQKMEDRPAAYISASAIGYYGNSGERLCREEDAPADNSFMVVCCKEWEKSVAPIADLGIRTTIMRIGIVLTPQGGALKEIVRPLRFGAGSYFGNGQAWWSWIHLDDVCRMFLWAAATAEVSGVYNAVAPHPVRNEPLVRATAGAMRQPAAFLPVPAMALRFLLGEMSAVVLNSNRVSAEKVQKAGFDFQFPKIEPALANLFSSGDVS